MHLFSFLLRAGAPVITSEWFIGAIVILLAGWSIVSGLRLHQGQRAVVSVLSQATNLINAEPTPLDFAHNFESSREKLDDVPMIGPAWSRFSECLIVPRNPGRPIAATSKPADWFDLGSMFREAKTDLRFHAALPGLLVGAGLLCTFLGLAVALAKAGELVAGNNPSDRLNGLRGLLDAASVKFITSLFGLLFSIAYALWRKRELHVAEKAFARFIAALQRQMPFRTTAFLQSEANDLMERQFAEVQRIGTDFFVNLGHTLEREFASGLQNHLTPLAEAIDKLAARLSGQNEGAVGTMMGAFIERLEGAVGESMRSTAETLKTLESGLAGLRGGMDEAATHMGRAAEEMASGMGRGAQDALGGITVQVAELVKGMRDAADEAGRGNRSAAEDLAQRMGIAADSLAQAIDQFQRRLGEGAAQGVDRLTAPIEAMLTQLTSLADAQRQAGATAATDLAETVGRAATSLEGTADKIANILGSGATDASNRLVAATEAMRDDLRSVLERFSSSLAEAGSSVEQGARSGGASLASAAAALGGDIAAAANRLTEAGDSAGTALRGGGADARAHIAEAARVLMDGAGSLNGRLAAIATASEGLAERAVALQAATRDAMEPLAAASVNLRSASASARDATSPLAETGQALRSAVEGLRLTTDSMGAAFRQADGLAGRLTAASDNFRTVDQAIGSTTSGLASQLGAMERQVSDFVRGMDTNLSKSVLALGAIAKGLENTADELADAKQRG